MGKDDTHSFKARESLITTLQEVHSKSGSLSRDTIAEIAADYQIPLSEVYGVASFYSFLSVKQTGRHVIRICNSLPCYLKNNHMIIQAVKREIGIGPGQTTADRRFSFELANCIGLCDEAPAMLIDNDAHVRLTPESIGQILQQYE